MEILSRQSALNLCGIYNTLEKRERLNIVRKAIHATPSEYLRALVRQDMENHGTVSHVTIGLDDVQNARFSEKSILDIHGEND